MVDRKEKPKSVHYSHQGRPRGSNNDEEEKRAALNEKGKVVDLALHRDQDIVFTGRTCSLWAIGFRSSTQLSASSHPDLGVRIVVTSIKQNPGYDSLN